MSERIDLNSEEADSLKMGCSLHPDTVREYRQCIDCPMDRDCSECEEGKGLESAMSNFLRPRLPFPSL